jgi:hypothetical protein
MAANMLIIDCSKYLNQCLLLRSLYNNKLIFTMPIDWKANISFKTFIARRENYQNSSHSAAFTSGRPVYFKSSTELVEPRNEENFHEISRSVAISPNMENLDLRETVGQKMLLQKLASGENLGLHEAVGTLEMQKMLLQKLARGENIVKGYQGGEYSIHNQRMEIGKGSSEHPSTIEGDLEEWKREMAQALYTTWSRHSKSKSRLP